MSSTFSRKLVAEFRSRDAALDSWNILLVKRVTNPCICMLRMYHDAWKLRETDLLLAARILSR